MRKLDFIFLKYFILLYWEGFQECFASSGNMVSTSGTISVQVSQYRDRRLVVPGNPFSPRLVSKARLDCTRSCAIQETCHAFNVYGNQGSYVCELLSDNLSRNKTTLQLLSQPGCTVWEKRGTGTPIPTSQMNPTQPMTTGIPRTISPTVTTSRTIITTSLKTTKSSTVTTASSTTTTPQLCADVRKGCLGTFPNCYDCIRSCIDWNNRNLSSVQVTLWPNGDGPDSVPISAICDSQSVTLVLLQVDTSSGLVKRNFIMPFSDIHRLVRLQVYPYIKFEFKSNPTSPTNTMSLYRNVFVGPDGTLANLTYYNLNTTDSIDIFNLGGKPMPPTRFVNVTDDRYNCGSFWLLDPTNDTYCPGGQLGMFGTVFKNGSQVIQTGLRVPTKPNDVTYFARITLRPSFNL